MDQNHPQYISTLELARFLGISRVAVLKRIQKKQIPAVKIGRSYAIPRNIIQEKFPNYRSNIAVDEQKYVSVLEASQLLGVSRSAISKRIERGLLNAKKVGRHYVIPIDVILSLKNQKTKTITTHKERLSIPECAQLMGISRIAVYKKVKKGMIKAERIGRHFVIAAHDIPHADPDVMREGCSNESHCSVLEAANYLGISRIAVFKKIKNGYIPAKKVGRSYVINLKDLMKD